MKRDPTCHETFKHFKFTIQTNFCKLVVKVINAHNFVDSSIIRTAISRYCHDVIVLYILIFL